VKRLRLLRANPIVDGIVTIVSAVLIAFVVQLWIAKPYRIPSESMVPTLEKGDRVITARLLLRVRDPQRGEVFVFHPNGLGSDVYAAPTASSENYVKRVIGMPGEVLGSRGGKVYVCKGGRYPDDPASPERTSGCAFLDEPYTNGQITGTLSDPGTDLAPVLIEPGKYFMMGDNRTHSADSREWGQVPRDQLIGRVFMTYWPVTRISVG
jgi:signal peptidase I